MWKKSTQFRYGRNELNLLNTQIYWCVYARPIVWLSASIWQMAEFLSFQYTNRRSYNFDTPILLYILPELFTPDSLKWTHVEIDPTQVKHVIWIFYVKVNMVQYMYGQLDCFRICIYPLYYSCFYSLIYTNILQLKVELYKKDSHGIPLYPLNSIIWHNMYLRQVDDMYGIIIRSSVFYEP